MSLESAVALNTISATDSTPPYQGLPEEPHKQVNLGKVLHRHLRGRYVLTLSLAVAGALAGGIGGYFIRSPKYRAEGLVHIQPVSTRVLNSKNDEGSVLPMFTSFVNTQAAYLQNDRVLAKARKSAAWRALGRPNDAEAEVTFAKQLVVKTNRESPELITVSYSDEQAQAALIAVREVIDAYQNLQDVFGGLDSKSAREKKQNTLADRKRSLETTVRDIETRIRTVTVEFPTDDLAKLGDIQLSQCTATNGHLRDLEIRLAERGIDPATFVDPPAAGDGTNKAAASPPRTPEQIASMDHSMAQYLQTLDMLRQQLEGLRSKGIGSEHQAVRGVQGEIDALQKIIAERTEKWVEPSAASGAALTDLSPQQMVNAYRSLRRQAEADRQQLDAINKARQKIESMRPELKIAQTNLDETNRLLDQMSVDSKVQELIGRIEVMTPDAPPSSPNDDPRKKFAAIGFIFGGGLPIGIMLLLSLADRRFRYADQADESCANAPMLGILPDLPGASQDPEQVAAAVHCIHHIRTRLQLGDPSRKIYAITSPTSGDGKTSLALSLAMSFTASGARTLVVDFDLVGRALTTRLGATCDHGIGHHLASPNGAALVTETSVPRLSLIPAGNEDVRFHSRIPREAFKTLIDSLRSRYDVIIVDTGPILGSLEANIAAAAADGVVMVVGRGQHGKRVQDAMTHLTNLGARVAGTVFNRAYAMDFSRSSVVSASFRSVRAVGGGSLRAGPVTQPKAALAAIAGLDPLVRGVAVDIHE